jgi:predicted AAA+ superfamily ATPase
MLYGGMPELLSLKGDAAKKSYLDGLLTTIYFRDIVERNNLADDILLGRVNDVLMSAAGSLTNPTRLANHIGTITGSVPDPRTVGRYLEFLEDAYLFRKAERYDVKGKKYIKTPAKYYYSDVGLRNARLGFRQLEETHLMENVIYNDLIRRGLDVDVGVVEYNTRNSEGKSERRQLEVDFVVNRGSERYYIQSALSIADPAKREQETASLLRIPDSFKKIVIVRDYLKPQYDEHGIMYVGVEQFLLDDGVLY